MRVFYLALMAFACTIVPIYADSQSGDSYNKYLQFVGAVRERVALAKMEPAIREEIDLLLNNIEESVALRVGEDALIELVLAVLAVCNQILISIQDLPAIIDVQILDTQDSLAFTIVDEANRIISAIDNISAIITGSVTVDNTAVLAAILNEQASLGFTIVDSADNATKSLGFTIVDQITNAQASLGFTIVDRVDNAVQSLGFTIVDYASSVLDAIAQLNLVVTNTTTFSNAPVLAAIADAQASLGFTIVDQVTNAQASLGFTIVDRVDNAVQSLGFTIVDRVDNAVQSLGFTIVDYASSVLDAITQLNLVVTNTTTFSNAPVLAAIADAQASLGFTIVDQVTNAQASLGFTIVDQVTNAQASLGFTIVDELNAVNTNLSTKLDNISTQIGALDGSLVELIVFEMLTAVETFTTLASITDHVLMTLTAIDALSTEIMQNYESIVELVTVAVQSVGFTIVDQVTNAQMSLGFTIIDRINDSQTSLGFTIVDQVTNAQASLGFTIVDYASSILDLLNNLNVVVTGTVAVDITPILTAISNEQASLGFTIVDRVDNAVQSLGFTIVDRVDNAVKSLGFTIVDQIQFASLCDPTPITQADVAGTLTLTSGLASTIKNYCLTEDITGNIILDAPGNIHLDLNNRSLTGNITISSSYNSVDNGTVFGVITVDSAYNSIANITVEAPVDSTRAIRITDGSGAVHDVIIDNCIIICDQPSTGDGTIGIEISAAASARNIFVSNSQILPGIGSASGGAGSDGIRITGGDGSASAIISNCEIMAGAGTTTGGNGIYLSGSSTTRIENCLIQAGSGATGGGYGVYILANNTYVENCEIQGGNATTSGSGGSGIYTSASTGPTYIQNCYISKTGNSVSGNGGDGIFIASGAVNAVVRNTTVGNTGTGSGGFRNGMAIFDDSTAAPSGTSIIYSNFAYDITNTSTRYVIQNKGAFTTDNGVNIITGLPGQFSNVYVP